MIQAELLYQLQELDQEIAAAQERVSEIQSSLGDTDALRQARQEVEAAEEEHRQWMTTARDLELETQALTNKISSSEDRLYSGSVTNPKELSDIQDEIASLQRRRDTLEDELLEAMFHCDEAQEALTAARAALSKTEAQWQTEQADSKQELQELEQRLVGAREEREKTRHSIADDHLAHYDTVQSRYGSITVTTLRDGVCGFCAVAPSSTKLSRIRGGRELLECSNCGRILLDL